MDFLKGLSEQLPWLIDAKGKILVGQWGKALIELIITYFQWLFDAVKFALNFVVEGSTSGLLMVPPMLWPLPWRVLPIGCSARGRLRSAC